MKKVKSKGIRTKNNTSANIKDLTAGITVIALVVTIVILLILAGISIVTLSRR